MSANLETLLESQIINVLEPSLVKQLAHFIRRKQVEKYSFSREKLIKQALEANADWISLQDFPIPIVRSEKQVNRKGSTASIASPKKSPAMSAAPLRSSKTSDSNQIDDIFAMDDVGPTAASMPPSVSPLTMSPVVSPSHHSHGSYGWKTISSQK
jgi:inhibitor of Bruton tyrosine kinase